MCSLHFSIAALAVAFGTCGLNLVAGTSPVHTNVKLQAVTQTDLKVLRHSLSANCNHSQGSGQRWHDTPSVCDLQDSSRHPF